MIDRELLKKAGVAANEIEQLEQAWNAFQAVATKTVSETPSIVCTGIYNAGKSTLLNALAGEDIFPTGDVPTTKVAAQAEFGGAIYIDTPGLNAEEEDDQETLAAYASADFILFVSNAQNGGVTASEAGWLQKLAAKYTTESLKQRLIYVLSHSAQVEPEELPSIEAHVRSDLEKTVGFAPEQIFCVDSILCQQGREQGETLLAENSGIPVLQKYLAERVAGAEGSLSQAHDAELGVRRKELLEQTGQIESVLIAGEHKENRALKSRQATVENCFKKASKDISDACSRLPYVGGSISVYVSCDTTRIKRMGVTSPFSVESDAKNELNRYGAKCVSEAKRVLDKCEREIKQRYYNTGMDSEYFRTCSSVNKILEELYLLLQQQNTPLKQLNEIHVEPDSDDLSRLPSYISQVRSDLEFYEGNGLFDTYYDVFGNRFESHNIEEGHYKKTLFGEKYVTDIGTEINIYYAAQGALEQVREQVNRFKERATSYIDDVLQPFQKRLRGEANKRLIELRKAADASHSTTQQVKSIQSALDYLSTLKKEVLQ